MNADFDFYGKTLEGAKQIAPRWKRCVNSVDNDLGEALGQAYVEEHSAREPSRIALTMAKQIEAAMQREIEGLAWMTNSQQEERARKAARGSQQDRLSGQMAGL